MLWHSFRTFKMAATTDIHLKVSAYIVILMVTDCKSCAIIEGVLHGDALLPCLISHAQDLNIDTFVVHWQTSDDRIIAHSFYSGTEHLEHQDDSFKGRTQLFPLEFPKGNLSLLLKNLKISDSGRYSCHVDLNDNANGYSKIDMVELLIRDADLIENHQTGIKTEERIKDRQEITQKSTQEQTEAGVPPKAHLWALFFGPILLILLLVAVHCTQKLMKTNGLQPEGLAADRGESGDDPLGHRQQNFSPSGYSSITETSRSSEPKFDEVMPEKEKTKVRRHLSSGVEIKTLKQIISSITERARKPKLLYGKVMSDEEKKKEHCHLLIDVKTERPKQAISTIMKRKRMSEPLLNERAPEQAMADEALGEWVKTPIRTKSLPSELNAIDGMRDRRKERGGKEDFKPGEVRGVSWF